MAQQRLDALSGLELEAIYHAAPIGLAALDRNFRYLRINDRLAEMNGASAQSHIGRSVREMIPQVADRVEVLLRKVLRARSPLLGVELHGETFALPGVRRVWVVNYTPLRDAKGKVVGINLAVEDVTVLRRLQREQAERLYMRELAAHVEQAREIERTRISRELHDELGQALNAIKLQIAWVVKDLRRPPELLKERLKEASRVVDASIQEVRRISRALRPASLDIVGLSAAIHETVAAFQAYTSVRCKVRLPSPEPSLSPEAATTLFRICQEALTNISRHAHATSVSVSLSVSKGLCMLRVRDNGTGMDDNPFGERGLGLIGMRERAHLVGGTVSIVGTRGKGTVVTAIVPLTRTMQ